MNILFSGPETYGQWTLDSSHVDWWKVAHAASLQMLFGEAKTMVVEARKKGTWVLLQNCHLYKKLGWHSYPCFTQLHILTQAAHHRCYLAPSVLHWLLWEECDLLCWCWFNPDLTCVCCHPIPLAYYQSGNHNCSHTHTHIQHYSRLLVTRQTTVCSLTSTSFHLLPYSSTDQGKRCCYYERARLFHKLSGFKQFQTLYGFPIYYASASYFSDSLHISSRATWTMSFLCYQSFQAIAVNNNKIIQNITNILCNFC